MSRPCMYGPRSLILTTAVRPSWSHRFTRTTKIGSHIFYRNGRRVASN